MITVELADQQTQLQVDAESLRAAVRHVVTGEDVEAASISVAIVDDAAIHELNRRYLQHDYPTDVLSFLLSEDRTPLEGEIIVSAETALREAARYGWQPADELVLYLIHGTLHLLGHDDCDDEHRARMRAREEHYLCALGRELPATKAAAATAQRKDDEPGESTA